MNCKNCPYNNGAVGKLNRPVITHPHGNYLQLMIPLEFCWHIVSDGVEQKNLQGTITNEMAVEVVLSRGKKEYSYKPEVVNNQVIIIDRGTLPIGTYDIAILIYDNGNRMRYKQRALLQVVDSVAQGVQYDNNEVNVFGIYPIVEGKITAISIGSDDVTLSENGKFQGDDTPEDNFADITAIYGDSSIEVSDDEVTLTI